MSGASQAAIERQRVPPFHLRTLLCAAMIVAAALVAYHNSFRAPFVFDDELAIRSNPSIRSLVTAWNPSGAVAGSPVSGRPLLNFSFALNHAISGEQTWSYHALNFGIHVASGLLLFGVIRRTLAGNALRASLGARADPIALLSALLWTVHPLQTESVTYVSQRAESMAGLFYLLTLWLYARGCAPGAARTWHAGAFVACLCGMATKETMVTAPVLVAAYDRVFIAGSWRELWARRRVSLLALASTWLLLAALLVNAEGRRGASAGLGLGVSPWHYLLTQCEAIVTYLKLAFWPHPLVLDHGTAVARSIAEVWWQGTIVVALLGATVWALVRRPLVGAPAAAFFLLLAPTTSIVPIVGQTIAEHRMYLPLAVIVVLVVIALDIRFGRRAPGALALAVVVLSGITVRRNADYASATGMMEDVLEKRPDNARAMVLLADYLRREGRTTEARRWLERSVELEPRAAPAWNNLGFTLLDLGEAEAAITAFERALAISPGDSDALANLGAAFAANGRIDEAITALQRAVESAPDNADIRLNLALLLARARRFTDAAGHFSIVIGQRADDVEARLAYADVLQALGETDESLVQMREAVRLRPRDASLRNSAGVAFARAGRLREALDHFDEAVRLDPKNASARQNAETARRRLGGG